MWTIWGATPLPFFHVLVVGTLGSGEGWLLAERGHKWTLVSSPIFSSFLVPFSLLAISIPTPWSPANSIILALGLYIPSFTQHILSVCSVPNIGLGGRETKIKSLFYSDACLDKITDLCEMGFQVVVTRGRTTLWEWKGAERSMEIGNGEEKGWEIATSKTSRKCLVHEASSQRLVWTVVPTVRIRVMGMAKTMNPLTVLEDNQHDSLRLAHRERVVKFMGANGPFQCCMHAFFFSLSQRH